MCYDETSELRALDGNRAEDFSLDELVQRHGFKIWATQRLIPHHKTIEVTEVGMTLKWLRQAAKNAPMPEAIIWDNPEANL